MRDNSPINNYHYQRITIYHINLELRGAKMIEEVSHSMSKGILTLVDNRIKYTEVFSILKIIRNTAVYWVQCDLLSTLNKSRLIWGKAHKIYKDNLPILIKIISSKKYTRKTSLKTLMRQRTCSSQNLTRWNSGRNRQSVKITQTDKLSDRFLRIKIMW